MKGLSYSKYAAALAAMRQAIADLRGYAGDASAVARRKPTKDMVEVLTARLSGARDALGRAEKELDRVRTDLDEENESTTAD